MRFFIFFFIMILYSTLASADVIKTIDLTIGNSTPINSTAPTSQSIGGDSGKSSHRSSSPIWCYNTSCSIGEICQDKHCVGITSPKTNSTIIGDLTTPIDNSSAVDNEITPINTSGLLGNSSAAEELIAPEKKPSIIPIFIFLAIALVLLGIFIYKKRKEQKEQKDTIEEALKDG